MIINFIGAILIWVVSTYLFYKAAGTLALNKLNIISYIYYLLLLQVLIGTILIYLGFDEHYTLKYLVNRDKSIELTINFVAIMMIMLPLVIIFVNKLLGFKADERLNEFFCKEIENDNSKYIFCLICALGIIQTLLLTVQLIKTGYIPIVKLFIHEPEFDFALERQLNKNSIFAINIYVRNIIIMLGIPILGYITFAYAIVEKKAKWWMLASVYFLEGIIVKTYDFAKSPIIFHLFIYFLIFIFIYHDKIKNFIIICFGMSMGAILVVMYKLTGYQGPFLDIYNGILGRTFFSQVGTLAYHFDLFSNVFKPLQGRSLSPIILSLIGLEPNQSLRSAKLVMDFYGSNNVAEGKAGVMNACFLGEAFANWGVGGAIFSIFYVGVFLALITMFVFKLKKTPVTVAMFAILIQYIGNMSQGGFVDFIYNITIVIIIVGCITLIYFDRIINGVRGIFINKIRKIE